MLKISEIRQVIYESVYLDHWATSKTTLELVKLLKSKGIIVVDDETYTNTTPMELSNEYDPMA